MSFLPNFCWCLYPGAFSAGDADGTYFSRYRTHRSTLRSFRHSDRGLVRSVRRGHSGIDRDHGHGPARAGHLFHGPHTGPGRHRDHGGHGHFCRGYTGGSGAHPGHTILGRVRGRVLRPDPEGPGRVCSGRGCDRGRHRRSDRFADPDHPGPAFGRGGHEVYLVRVFLAGLHRTQLRRSGDQGGPWSRAWSHC